MRRAIAKAMVNSKHTAPHTLMDDVKALVSALKNTQHLTLHSMKKLAKLYTNITGILVLLLILTEAY